MDHINGTILSISKSVGDQMGDSSTGGTMTVANAKNGREEFVSGSIVNWLTKGQYVSLDGEWQETRYNTEEFRAMRYSAKDQNAPTDYKLSHFFRSKLGIPLGEAIRFTRKFILHHANAHPIDTVFYALSGRGVADVLADTGITLPYETASRLEEYLKDLGTSMVQTYGMDNTLRDCMQVHLGGCSFNADGLFTAVMTHFRRSPQFADDYRSISESLQFYQPDDDARSDRNMDAFDRLFSMAHGMVDAFKKNPYNLSTLGVVSFWDAEIVGRTFNLPFDSTARYFSATGQAIFDRLDQTGSTVLKKVQVINALRSMLPAENANTIISSALTALEAYTQKNQERGFHGIQAAVDDWVAASISERVGRGRTQEQQDENKTDPLIPLIIPVKYEDTAQYYTHKAFYHNESMLAGYLQHINTHAEPLFTGSEDELNERIRQGELAFDTELDPDQRNALIGLCTSTLGVHTMTAGPGCGKTMMMEFLSYVLSGQNIQFVTPTGKAAKVLDSKVKDLGYNAITIHKFAAKQDSDGDIRLLVVDETSMLDIYALNGGIARLLDTSTAPHLIFLGDTDQLPSVGPGKILADLMESPIFDHHRLTKTFRNSGGILDYIQGVRDGRSFHPDGDAIHFIEDVVIGPQMDTNQSSMAFYAVMQRVVDSVKEVGAENTLLLVPFREPVSDTRNPRYGSHWDVKTCNTFLQDKINPDGEEIEGSRIRLGDRFINRKNSTLPTVKMAENSSSAAAIGEVYVPNGETGTVVDIRHVVLKNVNTLCVILRTDEGVYAAIPAPVNGPKAAREFRHIQLGYAITVHASQGSQANTVFAVFPGDPSKHRYGGMHQQLLYTAVSRAQNRLVVAGDPDVLNRIAKQRADERTTILPHRIADFQLAYDENMEETIPHSRMKPA